MATGAAAAVGAGALMYTSFTTMNAMGTVIDPDAKQPNGPATVTRVATGGAVTGACFFVVRRLGDW